MLRQTECSAVQSENQSLLAQVGELRRALRSELPDSSELPELIEDLQTKNLQLQLQLRQVAAPTAAVVRRS